MYWEGSGGTTPKLSISTGQTSGNSFFSASCNFEVGGYLSSLLMTTDDFKVEPSNQTFQYAFLFRGATSLKSAEKLIMPTNAYGNSSMRAMFSGCTAMTTPMKELPVQSLGAYTYQHMFWNCKSLTDSPIIRASATTTNYSHRYMFSGCTSLTAITTYIQSSSGTNPFANWVAGVNSSGYFYKHPNSSVFTTGTTKGASTIPTNFQVENIPNIT